MGRMSLGCCSSSGPAPSASAASLAIRLWDPRVPTHPSLSSLSGSSWTSSISRSPRGRRLRGDTECVERSAVDSLIQLRQRTNPRGLGCLSAANSLPCKRAASWNRSRLSLVVSFVVEFLAPLAKAAYAPEDVPGSVCPLPERPYETRSGLGVRPYDGGDIDSRTT